MPRPKALSRRALLGGGTGIAAAIAASSLRCRSRPDSEAVPPPESGMCGSSVSGAVRPPSAPPRPPLHPDALASFVEPLPIPRVLAPAGRRPDPTAAGRSIPYYRVEMREAEVRVHRDLPPTRMWTYEGAMPGPSFETRSGEGLLVEWVHALPETHFLPIDRTLHGAGPEHPEVRAVVHVHGAKAPPESDGFPESWIVRGQSYVAHYPNRQDAATLWYHDHAMGIERLNQYAGLFGCFFVRDALEDGLDLPKGPHELPLVLCDRLFFADGQLKYPISGNPDAPWVDDLNGDASLVNGKLRPYFEAEPGAYRFRVVNASNARSFDLEFARPAGGSPGDPAADRSPTAATLGFHQIGSDQGLLAQPVPLTRVTVAPGERVDLVVDFGACAGERVLLRNRLVPLLEVRVEKGPAKSRPLPDRLRPIHRFQRSDAANERTLMLRDYRDPRRGRMLMLLDGHYWHDPVTERPLLDSLEVWNLVNLTEETHPIHLHLVRFQVVERQLFDAATYLTFGKIVLSGPPIPPDANESGWKDTVRAHAGAITRIAARFEGFAGKYVWHCHVLEHAANEMMRPFEVVAG